MIFAGLAGELHWCCRCSLQGSPSSSDAPAPKARRIAHSANSRSADEWVTALYNSRASFLATTAVPEDPAEAIRGGLVLTPLLGCKARTPLDWTHAWAMLVNGREPLHSLSRSKENGRVTGMVATYDRISSSEPRPSSPGRAPYSSKVHSPPCLSSADFPILCLPGDKLFQSKELDNGYACHQ